MTPRVRAGRFRAQRQLERDYEALKPTTLRSVASKLRSRGITVPDADLEAFYNQAWHALYEQVSEGVAVENTGGFLVQVAYRRALDDLRRQAPLQRADFADVEGHAVEDATLDRIDDRRRLREFVEAMRDELDERERTAASLCYLHGYTRPQAAEAMGLSEGRMKKVMDDVSKTVGRFTRQIEAGTRCESRDSANKAYAIGLLDPEGPRYTAVRSHLDDCSACRADVLRMRGLAIVAPPVLLPWGAALAAGAIAGGGGAAAAGGAKAGSGGAGQGSRTAQVAVGAGVAAAVAAAVVVAVLALSGGDPAPEPVAEAPAATTPSASTPASTPAPAATSSTPAAKTKPKATPAQAAAPTKTQTTRTQTEQKTEPAPQTTTSAASASTSAAAPAAATPVATPAPAPVTPPTQTATQPAAPPVDASQEFGVEP